MKRIFVAVTIDAADPLREYYQKFRNWFKTDRITWVEEENLHITLKFIGDTPEDKIPGIHQALSRVASAYSAFPASIIGAGVFGSSYKPRVLWFGVEDAGRPMEKLGRDIAGALEEAGIEDDRQNFVPHLTIGRIKYIRQRRKLDEK
ncbi:MAG: RNA 2',3'-cyclic phosphodiesterase, partial [Proteobacteria bacterium]|nr:RNA 2',3'-cyclic phosphodiesterase [Pseudomonadota bacterium]